MRDPINNLLSIELPGELEEGYRRMAYKESDFFLTVGSLIVGVGVGVSSAIFFNTRIERNHDFFLIYLAVFYSLLIMGFISTKVSLKARDRMAMCTGLGVFTLGWFHIEMIYRCLSIEILHGSVGMMAGLILIYYILERVFLTSVLFSGIGISVVFSLRYLDVPTIDVNQVIWQGFAANCVGFFISAYLGKSARERYKLGVEVEEERQKASTLLYRILPKPIADQLISGQKNQAQNHSSVSVLFADLVNFTHLSQKMKASSLVWYLDELFSKMDAAAEALGVEKIKTIGDGYMAVCGCPVEREDHADRMKKFATEQINIVEQFNRDNGTRFSIRVAIHSGPVVAGVICEKRFCYDLWGSTVNTASRLEALSEINTVLVSKTCWDLIQDKEDVFAEKRTVHPKGMKPMEAYILRASEPYPELEKVP